MKIISSGYSGLEIKAENDAERVYLGEFLSDMGKKRRKQLEGFMYVDMDSLCYTDKDSPALEVSPEFTISYNSKTKNASCWGLIDKIHLRAFGV